MLESIVSNMYDAVSFGVQNVAQGRLGVRSVAMKTLAVAVLASLVTDVAAYSVGTHFYNTVAPYNQQVCEKDYWSGREICWTEECKQVGVRCWLGSCQPNIVCNRI